MERERLINSYIDEIFVSGRIHGLPDSINKRYAGQIEQREYVGKILRDLSAADSSESIYHLEMVGKVSEFLAEKAGFTHERSRKIGLFARLHDVGKVGVPMDILNKKGKLTAEEFDEIKKHTEIGYNLLVGTGIPSSGLKIVRYHHERWNGTGYCGLKGRNIPIGARIVTIADVYDALRMKRPYKNAMTHEEAMEIITSESGTHFDPGLVEILVRYSDEIEKMYLLSGLHTAA